MEYISDVFDKSKVRANAFNLIVSGCGTGKTYFVAHHLLEQYPDIKPEEVLMVCSRSMIIKQQSKDGHMKKLNKDRMRIVTKLTVSDKEWKEMYGEESECHIATLGSDSEWSGGFPEIIESGINVLTYDRLAYILRNGNRSGQPAFNRAKIVIFDECHSLFSDSFISGIDMIRLWITMASIHQKTIFFGLTATPDQFYGNASKSGISVNTLLPSPIYRYRAKEFYTIDFDELSDALNGGKFPGKTLTLCRSVEDCERLHAAVRDSAILISKSHEHYSDDIDALRDYICENETFPDTVVENGEAHPLKHLFVTTTAREGINLRENSGVKTVVCCYHDPINVIQIAGRTRYDLDCLVVADMPLRYNVGQTDHYAAAFSQLFREFIDDANDAWLTYIRPIMSDDCKVNKIRRSYSSLADKLDVALKENWIAPESCVDKTPWFIYQKEQKQALVEALKSLDVLPKRKQGGITFPYAIKELSKYGYEVESCAKYIDRVKRRGYYITGGSCDKNRLSYIKSTSNNRGNIYPLGDTAEDVASNLSGGDDCAKNDILAAFSKWADRGYSEHTICYAVGRRRDYVGYFVDAGRPADGIDRAVRQCAKCGIQKAG